MPDHKAEQQRRVNTVNDMVLVIGDHGRRFFYSKSTDRYAHLELDHRGIVWWIDDYSGKRIYTHDKDGRWLGFTHGGTLRSLVLQFKEYIKKGTPVRAVAFGPWPPEYCDGDLWGYGEDMAIVRAKAKDLGIIE